MKTISERDGKNVNMQVVGDLHQYPDGSVHTVKEGKAVWEEGSGGSGGDSDGSGGVFIVNILQNGDDGFFDKTASEVFAAMRTMSVICITHADDIWMYSSILAAKLDDANTDYTFYVSKGSRAVSFTAASGDAYPVAVK